MPSFRTVRGMRDILSEETRILNNVIFKARGTAKNYGYEELTTPIVESYDLLSLKSGEELRARMFVFKDLGNRTVALRPEFTASIARLVTTTFKNQPKPLRIFSVGSVYRYDEPQRGRYREFWQSNFELIGSNRPEADAELILLTNSLLKAVGLQNYFFKIGHVGVLKGILEQEKLSESAQNAILQRMDKKDYDEAFKLVGNDKCRDTLRGLIELKNKNPFETAKMIKSYVGGCKKAETAANNLLNILKLVTESDCPIEIVEPAFARGLEYYTGMIFEVYIPELDTALGGGGRYDELIEVFGGESTPAVGVAHGLDRIILAMQLQKEHITVKKEKKVIVISVDDKLKIEALRITQMLRDRKISAVVEVMGRKIAKALEDADRRKIDYAVIVGERELKEDSVVLRDMRKREQQIIKIGKIAEMIKD